MTGPPTTPQGFGDAKKGENFSELYLNLLSLFLIIISFALIFPSSMLDILVSVFAYIDSNITTSDALMLILAFSITYFSHEFLHKVGYSFYNYDAEIRWIRGYTILQEEFHTIEEYNKILVLPLIAINSICLFGHFIIPHQNTAMVFSLIFVINSGFSAKDIHAYIHNQKYSGETKIWCSDNGENTVNFKFEPKP